MKKFTVAIVGATGMVGRAFLQVLKERNFPVQELKPLASPRSAGSKISFAGKEYTVQVAEPEAFENVDIAFFSAGTEISKELAPEAVRKGAVVIDNSNAFRMDKDVPLVVPEVNPEDLAKHKGIIANPNCSTIQMVVALQPLHEKAGLKRVVVSTYQAVSGSGKEAVDGLLRESKNVMEGKDAEPKNLPYGGAKRFHQIAFNLVPQLDVFVEDDYTKEEMKMVNETRKIMSIPNLRLSSTTVRVPVLNGHSESINMEFDNPISPAEAKTVLKQAPGVVVQDNPAELEYPTPFVIDGKDEVYVGRIRIDRSVDNGLNMWVVADNIRKGAATNSIQIAETMIEKALL